MVKKFSTAKEIAAFLGMNVYTVYKMAREGRLPSYRLGKLRRFSLPEIETWVENKRERVA